MAGISSKAAGRLENKSKFNGIEHNSDFDLNMYDAFYRNLDPQIGRFWQIDPESESLEEYSPFASMYNNPISNIDPLGDFATRVGAWLHKVFNGGGTIGQNSYGEWYVQKSIESDDGSAGISLTYGKGRSATTAYREKLLSEYESLEQEERMTQLGIYDPSLTMSQARQNFAGISSGVVIPNITVKPITITINAPKIISSAKPIALLESQGARLLRIAQHPKLKDLVSRLWRPGAKFGDGSTGAIIRLEQSSGVAASASGSHIQKAQEALGTAKKLLNGNYGHLSESDRKVVFEIIENLTNATGLKY
jgi:RHS repeat-associated protein